MRLRVAIVGCGRISEVYKHCFKVLDEHIQVCYAIDIKKERADAFASEFPDCKSITDYRECLQGDIDVLHITTPHYCHKPMAVEALKHQVHVLTEKPIAIYLQDAKAMIQAAKEENMKLGVIFQTRYAKGFRGIKEAVDSGKIGKILGARSYLSWSRADDYYALSDWKGTWDKEGGGVLIDQAIHSIDCVRDIIGDDVVKIEGTISNRNHKRVDVEDTAEAFIHFKNGVIYQLYACNCYPYDAPIYIEIVGEKGLVSLTKDKGMIHLHGQEPYEVEKLNDQQQVGKDYWGTSHIEQIKDFYHSICEDVPVTIDGEEGLKTLEVVRGIYQSGFSGKALQLPFDEISINGLGG